MPACTQQRPRAMPRPTPQEGKHEAPSSDPFQSAFDHLFEVRFRGIHHRFGPGHFHENISRLRAKHGRGHTVVLFGHLAAKRRTIHKRSIGKQKRHRSLTHLRVIHLEFRLRIRQTAPPNAANSPAPLQRCPAQNRRIHIQQLPLLLPGTENCAARMRLSVFSISAAGLVKVCSLTLTLDPQP